MSLFFINAFAEPKATSGEQTRRGQGRWSTSSASLARQGNESMGEYYRRTGYSSFGPIDARQVRGGRATVRNAQNGRYRG